MSRETALARTPRSWRSRFDRWAAPLGLVAATFLAYFPCLRGRFVWDDDSWTTNLKPLFESGAGLGKMWGDFSALQQYYPLTGTTFWVDYQLWGFWTLPYHVENVLLHLVSVVLFWTLLKRLKVPGAALAAGILALHPMMVESVAWITERKNALSLVLFLGALLSYGRFTRFWVEPGATGDTGEVPDPRRRRFYFLAVGLFLAAYLAKATVWAFPPVLLLVAWWKRGRLRWCEDVLPTLPLFALSVSLGLIIAHLEHHHVGATGPEWNWSFADRCLIAGRAVWFYTTGLVWPARVCFIYGRWPLEPHAVGPWLWPASVLGALLVLWLQRHRFGRGPLAASLYFIGTALPLLGFVNAYGMRYSFVWDHWAYLPSLGLLALGGAALSKLGERALRPTTRQLAAGCLLLAFGALTWQQAGVYRSDEALWRDTVNKNPSAWIAYHYLGLYADARGASEEAQACYRKSIALYPNPEACYNLANTLALAGRGREAIPFYLEAVRLRPDLLAAYLDLGAVLAAQGRLAEAIARYRTAIGLEPGRAQTHWCLAATLERAGQVAEAVRAYREALRLSPDLVPALENLAAILASGPDPKARNGAEAVTLAERACRLTQYQEPHSVSTLAMAYAEAGRFGEATSMAERAAGLAASGGDPEGVKVNRALAEQYRSGRPYREAARQAGEAAELPNH